MKRVYIGVDVGTSGCKAAAIGGDGGICGIESVRYDDSLACSGPGCYDQPAAVLRGAAFGLSLIHICAGIIKSVQNCKKQTLSGDGQPPRRAFVLIAGPSFRAGLRKNSSQI